MTLADGQVIQHRYRIVSLLGQGGMGAIYHAWDTRLSIPVAIKEMRPQPGMDPSLLDQLRQQFQQEAVVVARLHHAHLVRVTDFFEESGNAYLVMGFVEGENLAHCIKREGALPEAQVLEWAEQLLYALAYCHTRGVIHRDVKPQNVIIRPDGQAVLVDFGLMKLWDPGDPHTRTAMRGMGTPEYAPPEQYDAQIGHTDHRSDIYSLGATLYHALTGQAPPTATMRIANPGKFQPPRAINPRISPRAEAAVLRATELAMEKRFATAQDMAAALKGEAARTTATAPTGGTTKVMGKTQPAPTVRRRGETTQIARAIPPAPPTRRRRAPAWTRVLGRLIILALLAAAVIGMYGWKGRSILAPQVNGTVEKTAGDTAPAGVTETATPTASPSPTGTHTPTSTPTHTPTRTRRATRTPMRTPIGTHSPTLSATPTATRTPQPTSGPPSDAALITFEQWTTWQRGDQPYGELTQTQEHVRSGSYAAKLRYDFPATSEDYVVFAHPMSLSGQPNTIAAWVYGDGSDHFLNVWVQDAEDEIWSVHLGRVSDPGWQQMVGTLDPSLSWPSGHVSGPETGGIDYPVSFYALVLDRPGSGSRSGQIYVDDISVWRETTSATVTPVAEGPTPVAPTSTPPPSGQVGRILYTIEAGGTYYLGSTDPSWSQGQIIGPTTYEQSTCAGGATATTLEGQAFNLLYGYRCAIGSPQQCPSPDGKYKVTIWESAGDYSLGVYRLSDGTLVQATYDGPLNTHEPLLWSPDSARFYFTIDHTLHQASPHSAGYQPVAPIAYEPYLSPDGSMILYTQPVGTAGAHDLWVADTDGSNPRNVTNAPGTYKLCARWGD